MKLRPYLALIFLTSSVFSLSSSSLDAINITIDYSYDTNNFFNLSTSNGQKARATIEAAASYYSSVITDTFSSITTPDPFVNSDATYSWNWELRFNHPAMENQTIAVDNPSISADEYRIYVGSQNHSGNTLGTGGPGGMGYSYGGSRYSSDIDAIDAITDQFYSDITTRGETSGFANWGGVLSFDSNTTWNYDHTANPATNQSDLYSVAIHELGHTLGLGTSDEWSALITNSEFTGVNAINANGGFRPPISPGGGHWADDTESRVYGGTATQEAALSPTITTGTRKVLTLLDAAGLSDIGWTLVEPVAAGLLGDYNDDGTVDAADYTVWRDSLQSTTNLAADGSGNGIVDQADYGIWVSNFGTSSASANTVAVPEPKTWVLALFSLALFSCFVRLR